MSKTRRELITDHPITARLHYDVTDEELVCISRAMESAGVAAPMALFDFAVERICAQYGVPVPTTAFVRGRKAILHADMISSAKD